MVPMTPEEEGRLMYEATKSPEQKVTDLWLQLPQDKRKTRLDVLAFFSEVLEKNSYLLQSIPEPKYQTVQAWLSTQLDKQ